MIVWMIIIAVILMTICLPSIAGALIRLMAPKVQIFWISLGVGVCFSILTEVIGGARASKATLVAQIDSLRSIGDAQTLLGVVIIIMVLAKIGLFAALSTLGVDWVDRLRAKRKST